VPGQELFQKGCAAGVLVCECGVWWRASEGYLKGKQHACFLQDMGLADDLSIEKGLMDALR
jgi:hypothetical protein